MGSWVPFQVDCFMHHNENKISEQGLLTIFVRRSPFAVHRNVDTLTRPSGFPNPQSAIRNSASCILYSLFCILSPITPLSLAKLDPQAIVCTTVMATYIYETVPDSPDLPIRRFEVRQSMKDSPLTHDPETGQRVRRVIAGGMGVIMTGARAPRASSSPRSGCGTGRCSCC
jgi:predicted nucleic acid-binding Zn ribbon protein